MTSKDAQSRNRLGSRSPGVFSYSFLIGSVALAACFVAARWWNGPSAANAQVPRTKVPAAPATPTAPTGKAAPKSPAPAATAPPRGALKQPTAGVSPASAIAPTSGGATLPKTPIQAQGNKPVAVVNGEPITPDQLGNECLRRFGTDVIESLVNKQLIWQELQRQKIQITEQDVENEVDRMAGKFGLSKDRYQTMLREEREITSDQYRREIIWPTLALRKLVANKISVSEAELKEAFESQYGAQVRVRMIAVSTQAKAAQVHKEVTAQPDRFGDIAKEKSEDQNSASGRGLIPPIRKHVGYPELEQAAFALKVGQISPVIHVANQFLILKCEQHIEQSYVSSEKLRLVEQQLYDQIRDNKLRTAAGELFQTLQDKAQVVNVFNDDRLKQQMPGVAATINGGQISMKQLADECIARHGKDVLEGEISRRLLEQELKRRNKQVMQPAIDDEIKRAADAYAFHKTDGTPDVEGWLKSVTETEHLSVDLYVRDMVWPSVALKTIVGDNVQITQDDLQKGFESNYGERVEALAIVVGSQRHANQIWEQARHNPTEQFFGELAEQHSIEPVSRANRGKVPPIRRHGGQPLIEEEAFRLKVGELSGIIAIGDKFVILRCAGRTKPVVSDFTAVEGELRKDIQEKKLRIAMAEEFDRLRESAQIDNFLANTTQSGTRIANNTGKTVATPTKANPAPANAVKR